MCSASAEELIQVVLYFREKFDQLWELAQRTRLDVAGQLLDLGTRQLQPLRLK
jgi:hypothetical protein